MIFWAFSLGFLEALIIYYLKLLGPRDFTCAGELGSFSSLDWAGNQVADKVK